MTTTVKYSTDGKETTNEMMGAPTKSTAKWDGNALLVVTKADFQGNEITQQQVDALAGRQGAH